MGLTQEQSLITGYMQAPDFMGMMQETPINNGESAGSTINNADESGSTYNDGRRCRLQKL